MIVEVGSGTPGLLKAFGPSAITAMVTVGAAFLAARTVVLQLKTQHQQALAQAKHNEGLKVKLDIYRQIRISCEATVDAEVNYTNYAKFFCSMAELSSRGLGVTPDARVPELISRKGIFANRAIELIRIIEGWQIIDPRITVFQDAINSAIYDVDAAYHAYFEIVLTMMPIDLPDGQVGWAPPEAVRLQQLKAATTRVDNASGDFGAYVFDFEMELQGLLVGELFSHRVKPRRPIDPRKKVVTLDNHEELRRYFREETSWGLEAARIEAEVRSRVRSED